MTPIPCPFCGKDKTSLWGYRPNRYVTCLHCDADGPTVQASNAKDDESAITAWNTRTSVKVNETVTLALMDCIKKLQQPCFQSDIAKVHTFAMAELRKLHGEAPDDL